MMNDPAEYRWSSYGEAIAGEILHGWRGDRQPDICQRGVRQVERAIWGEAQGRRAEVARQRRSRVGAAMELRDLRKSILNKANKPGLFCGAGRDGISLA
jgi:hypothetical protein